MVPSLIRNNLAGLRRRERLLTFAFGAACWLSLVSLLLLACCFVDWLVDRYQDTPMLLRAGMFALQLVIALVSGAVLLIWPQMKRWSDSALALWVESKLPRFGHR